MMLSDYQLKPHVVRAMSFFNGCFVLVPNAWWILRSYRSSASASRDSTYVIFIEEIVYRMQDHWTCCTKRCIRRKTKAKSVLCTYSVAVLRLKPCALYPAVHCLAQVEEAS